MTQQEQHHTYVPGPRDGEHEDEQVAVGTAHAPSADEDDDAAETYPPATYASGSADPALAERDDVEVVDRDEALAEADRDDNADGYADGDRTQAIEHDEVDAAHEEAVRENEERTDDDEDEVDAAYDNAVRENEVRDTDDLDTAYAAGDATVGDVRPEDDRDEDEVAGAEEAEDRQWAAEHATELRAGSTDLDSETDLDTDRDDEPVVVEDAGNADVQADERVAEPVDYAATDAQVIEPGTDEEVASRPGSVDVTAIGAVWADGAVDGLRERWRELQLRFIDEPRSVADEADQLVGEAVETITNALQAQRQQLANWQNEPGDDTERLRAAVRGYRDYLDRLLGM